MKQITFLLFLLGTFNGVAQVNLDSLWNIWNDEAQSDNNRIEAMDDICWKGYLFSQPDSGFYFAQLLIDFAKENGQKKHVANGFNMQGVSFSIQGEYGKSVEYFTKSLKLSKEIGDKSGITKALNNIGLIYKRQSNYDKAIEYYMRSLKLSEELKDKSLIASSLNNLGVIYNKQGLDDKAFDYYMRSLKLSEELGDKSVIGASLNNIGMIYKRQGNDDKAIDYYMRSLKISKEIGDKQGVSTSLDNLGRIYEDQGTFDKAFDYYMRSLKLSEEIGDKRGLAVSLNNLGVLYSDEGNYDKAFDYFTRGLKFSEEIGDKSLMTISLNYIGKCYGRQGYYTKAIDYCQRSLAVGQELGNITSIRNAAESLWDLNKKSGNFKESLEMYELYIVTRDSIISLNNQRAVIKLEYKFQYDKQKVLDDTENDKLLLIEAEKRDKQKVIISAITVGSLVLILFLVFAFNKLKVTKRQKKIIQSQKEIVDKANEKLNEINIELIVKRNEIESQKTEIEKSLNREKELGMLKVSFVSTASHQFRTPLAVIQSNVELLEMFNNGDEKIDLEKYKKVTDRITGGIAKMTELMDEVLILGKLTSGNVSYTPEDVDLVEFCEELSEEFSAIQIDERSLNVVIHGEPYNCHLDPKLLTHSLSNLISNAFKYSLGKKNPELAIQFKPTEVAVTLTDYGMGIPENELSSLFQPFFRANNVTEIKGTGLGLSIAKEYIEINKGTISVNSTEGKGSCFEIKIKKT